MTSQQPDDTTPGEIISTVELTPLPNDPKNQQVYAYTPLGNIRLMGLKKAVEESFNPGDLYEVVITKK